ncbi:MAG TPA: hypothetical protein VEZ11_00785, partial [Thermoanaerobaculia bacterium]|nr:hypothetical protein [Thermoanaerobaculia bacterium]
MKPQEPIPHNYSIRKLNLIFALSSLVLLLVTVGMVGYDYVRGWKWFQWQFMKMQQERIEQQLQTARTEEGKARLEQLDQQVREHRREIARNRDQFLVAQKDLDDWEGKHYAADQDYRFTKATLDAKRYDAEAAVVQKSPNAGKVRKEYEDLSKRFHELDLRLQDVTRGRDAAKARLDVWQKKIRDLEDKEKELNATVDLLNKQLTAVEPSKDFFILNAPMLDFISPTFKVDQVVLPDLFADVNYMTIPRVDRCMTCHRAIDRTGFESKKEAARLSSDLKSKLDNGLIAPDKIDDAKKRIKELKEIQDAPEDVLNPWRTHPRLETFVGSASPHPLLEFGCTACHHGQDRATEFGRAGHVPASVKMEKRWSHAGLVIIPAP